MTGLIVTEFICWIATFFSKGFCLYTILLIIPTIMFAGRKIGFYKKWTVNMGCECVFLFFSIIWSLLFHKFIWWKYVITIFIRLIAVGLIMYDDSTFVYVKEEEVDE